MSAIDIAMPFDFAEQATAETSAKPVTAVHSGLPAETSEIDRVLVPCDFSDSSKRALTWACALLRGKGSLYLLHVAAPWTVPAMDLGAPVPIPPPSAEEIAKQKSELEGKLREFARACDLQSDISMHVECVEAFDPADAIVAATRRLAVDAVCLTTHGRSGLSRALLGSVAEGVLRHVTVPVFVITPRER